MPTATGKKSGPAVVAQGRADFTQWDTLAMYPEIERGHPLRVLAGIHAGCQELIANDQARTIREIRGRHVGIGAFGNSDHWFLAGALAYIGIRPDRDVTWVSGEGVLDGGGLFEANKVDAFLGFAPQPQKLRHRGLGHTILKTVSDRPWSQYFC